MSQKNIQYFYIYNAIKSAEFSKERKWLAIKNKEEIAKTKDEMQPDGEYQMSGNKITVRTLDLYQSFAEIRKELDGIVAEHF